MQRIEAAHEKPYLFREKLWISREKVPISQE